MGGGGGGDPQIPPLDPRLVIAIVVMKISVILKIFWALRRHHRPTFGLILINFLRSALFIAHL